MIKSSILNPLYLILIPYGGMWGAYKVGYGAITLFIFVFTIIYLIKFSGKIKLDDREHLLIILFLLPILSVLFSDVYIYIATDYYWIDSDLVELIRPVYFFMCIILAMHYLKINLSQAQIVPLLIISFANVLITISPHLKVIENLSYIYAEGVIYSPGYSAFRATGLAGQPGKEGILSFLLIAISVLINKYNKDAFSGWRFYTVILANSTCILLTVSRTSLIMLLALLFVLFFRNIKLLAFIAIALFVYAYVEREFFGYLIEKMARGGLDEGKLSTLGHRLVLKEWALDVMSKRIDTVIFGIGDSKEYISRFRHPYAFDLTLKQPDSSQTVWMLRYGIVGLIIHYLPFIWCLICLLKKKVTNNLIEIAIIGSIVLFSLFDPPFHEPKSQILISFIIAMVLMNVKVSGREIEKN